MLARSVLRGEATPVTANPGAYRAIRRGVGAYTARGGSIGWLVNEHGLLAVDSQFPDTARAFLQDLPGRDNRALDVLINSHHHPDHTAGNSVLGPAAARHVAQNKVPALQRARAERDLRLDGQVYARELFAEDWRVEIGDEVVVARHRGPAHTSGDAIVHFEKANVVHLGDLVFNRVYPVVDRAGGATVLGWIEVLQRLERDFAADTLFICGHGHTDKSVVCTREDIMVFRLFLERMRDLVQSEIVMGKPRVQIEARAEVPGHKDWLLPAHARLRDALGAVFEELGGT